MYLPYIFVHESISYVEQQLIGDKECLTSWDSVLFYTLIHSNLFPQTILKKFQTGREIAQMNKYIKIIEHFVLRLPTVALKVGLFKISLYVFGILTH